MAYTPTVWVNDAAPAINATNLNKIETGILEAHEVLEAEIETLDNRISNLELLMGQFLIKMDIMISHLSMINDDAEITEEDL